MENFSHFIFARALHAIGVLFWIGGVAFVTTVLIPSLKKITNTDDRLALFEQLEGKFGLQAKIATLLTGLSGYYMLEVMNAWDRYLQPQFWWMHLMTLVWAIFTLVLFVFEPLFLHQLFREMAIKNSDKTFARLHLMHIVLLTLSVVAVLGAVVGSHGFYFSI